MPGGWGGLILTALIVYVIANLVLSFFNKGDEPTISYTEFSKQVADNNVTKIYSKGDAIQGQLKKEQPTPGGSDSSSKNYTKFKTQRPSFADDDLWANLEKHDVTVTASPVVQERSFLANLLISLAPMFLLVALWIFISRRMRQGMGGGMAGGMLGRKQPPKPVELEPGTERTTFADVAGIDEVQGSSATSSTSSRTLTPTARWARRCPAASSCRARREPARRSWPGPSRARPVSRSSPRPPPSSSR